jgi:hypothetical protein
VNVRRLAECGSVNAHKDQNKKIGKSHDVIENTCRKNVSRAFSHDVAENTGT